MVEQNKVEKLTENLKEYVNTRYELMELNACDKLSVVGSEIVSGVLIGLIGFLFLIFISMAAGYYFSYLIGDRFSGFFIVGGIYFVTGIIVIVSRKKLMSGPIRSLIINEIFNQDNEKSKN